MDFITNLLPLKVYRGTVYNVILVIIDYFLKYALYILTSKKASIEDLADIFLN